VGWQGPGPHMLLGMPACLYLRFFVEVVGRCSRGGRLFGYLGYYDASASQSPSLAATAPDTTALFVEHVVRHYGVPLSIVSDRDSKFTGDIRRCVFGMLGTRLATYVVGDLVHLSTANLETAGTFRTFK
jgi:hypothetical protein